MTDLVDQTLDGKYRVTKKLGAGGMGAVYAADHLLLDREVAIKVLRTDMAGRDEAIKRFYREAKAAASLGHPNIIQIFDVGMLANGEPFIVMERLHGESLGDRLERAVRLSVAETTSILLQVLSALAATHERGIIHRDLKPDNIFLSPGPQSGLKVTLLDFGISKIPDSNEVTKLTTTGAILGTPFYMCPEQAMGDKDLDRRVDLYAVGAILYECLTGQLPFEAENYNQLLFAIVGKEPVPPRQLRPELPEQFEVIIQRAMAKDRQQRTPTAQALGEALQPFASRAPDTAAGLNQTLSCEEKTRVDASCEQQFMATALLSNAEPKPNLADRPTQLLTQTLASGHGLPLHERATETPFSWTTHQAQASRSEKSRLYWYLGGSAAGVTAIITAIILVIVYTGNDTSEPTNKNQSNASATHIVHRDAQASSTVARHDASPLPVSPPIGMKSVPPQETVSVRITVVPKTAWIFLDGKLLPQNPYVGKFEKSSHEHRLIAKAQGYHDLEQVVRFDKQVTLKLKLKPTKKRKVRTRRWPSTKRRRRRPDITNKAPF